MALSADWVWNLLQLKRTPRAGWFRVGVERPESVADHSYSLAMLVRRIAPGVEGVDPARAVLMALLHDFAEARLTDIPNPAKWLLPEGAFLEAERKVVAEQWADDPEAREIIEDFLVGESAEARLVHACDNLEFLIQAAAYHRFGHQGIDEMFRRSRARGGGAFDHEATRPLAEEILRERGF